MKYGKMKKVFAAMICAAMALGTVACGGETTASDTSVESDANAENEAQADHGDVADDDAESDGATGDDAESESQGQADNALEFEDGKVKFYDFYDEFVGYVSVPEDFDINYTYSNKNKVVLTKDNHELHVDMGIPDWIQAYIDGEEIPYHENYVSEEIGQLDETISTSQGEVTIYTYKAVVKEWSDESTDYTAILTIGDKYITFTTYDDYLESWGYTIEDLVKAVFE